MELLKNLPKIIAKSNYLKHLKNIVFWKKFHRKAKLTCSRWEICGKKSGNKGFTNYKVSFSKIVVKLYKLQLIDPTQNQSKSYELSIG